MTPQRKAVEDALDAYFSGKISVAEAFRRAYGPHGEDTAVSLAHPIQSPSHGRTSARRNRTRWTKRK